MLAHTYVYFHEHNICVHAYTHAHTHCHAGSHTLIHVYILKTTHLHTCMSTHKHVGSHTPMHGYTFLSTTIAYSPCTHTLVAKHKFLIMMVQTHALRHKVCPLNVFSAHACILFSISVPIETDLCTL